VRISRGSSFAALLRTMPAMLGVALCLVGLGMVFFGWRHPAVDVGVIIRGVLVYGGALACGAGALLLGLYALFRRGSA
jgi:hypothetical protein